MRLLVTILLAMAASLASFPQSKAPARKAATSQKGGNGQQDNSIKGLRNQRANVQKKIREQERRLEENKANVTRQMDDLMAINEEIGRSQRTIEGIERDLERIEESIGMLNSQLVTLEGQLSERKAKYIESLRYLARNRTVQDRLMFIFSARNFAQMYRRMRFVREYATYQRAQGEMVKDKQAQIQEKHRELERVKLQKADLLSKGQQEQEALEGKQAEQQRMVASLRKEQKTIKSVIEEQKRKDSSLNAQIDKLIAEEIARAKARAEEEARQKAEAAAAEARRREEELARRKAEAEAAARENERKIAEAREREERLKAEAKAAERKGEQERERAERAAKEAEANRQATERKARQEEMRRNSEVAQAKKAASESASMDTQDRKLSGSFERNRGQLPMPITGSYKIVSHFGQYNVEGLKNVQLDNKGISIQGSAGASARAVFDGEVSAVFSFEGSKVVMVRHGQYISVYCNLGSVDVSRGQKVGTGQALGAIGKDNILQFQLRRGTDKLNPEIWLRK